MSAHDVIPIVSSTGLVILGKFMPVITSIQNAHVYPIVIETAQVLSYTGAIAIAVVTIYFKIKDSGKNGNRG